MWVEGALRGEVRECREGWTAAGWLLECRLIVLYTWRASVLLVTPLSRFLCSWSRRPTLMLRTVCCGGMGGVCVCVGGGGVCRLFSILAITSFCPCLSISHFLFLSLSSRASINKKNQDVRQKEPRGHMTKHSGKAMMRQH